MAEDNNYVNHIFDKTFKRILTLSSGAVISLINGLFNTDYPPDSELYYNMTENVNDDLKRTLSDTIITINQCHSYHLEAQMYADSTIIFRIFDYGYRHALKQDKSKDILYFPEPVVIYLDAPGSIPDKHAVVLDFGTQGTFTYSVPTCNFIAMTPEEIEQKHMIILLPFYILKLRKDIRRARTCENIEALKNLILNVILSLVEKHTEAGLLSINDQRVIKRLLLKLYQHVYAHYQEMEEQGMNDIIDESLDLDIDNINREHQKQVDSLNTEIEGLNLDIDNINREHQKQVDSLNIEHQKQVDELEAEHQKALEYKDRIILAYKLLAKEVSVEMIAEQTGLSLEMIREL